jgi:hypothetical protein
MEERSLILWVLEDSVNSVKIPHKPSGVSKEFHQFCKDVLDFMYSTSSIKVNGQDVKYRSAFGSFYIPFNVIKEGVVLPDINTIQVRVGTHIPELRKGETLIPVIISNNYRKGLYDHEMSSIKLKILDFIETYQPVNSSIYISNRILSKTEEVPNATVIAKALHKYIKDGKIKSLEAVDWEKRGNGATVKTDRIVFDFARYGEKLRVNFIETGQPPKYRETKKKTIPEILEQIQKWLAKDYKIT